MGEFLETYNLPKLNHKETENRNGPITSKKIESVIKNLSINKSPGPDGFTGELYQTFKEELIAIFLTIFQKCRRGGNTSKLILRGQSYSDSKARQG